MIPLLSACYFGSVEHYRLFARHERVVIDAGEHYIRQSYRTRTTVVGPNGPQDLSVQVQHDGRKMPMREVRLSRAETWPQQHLHALRSAYGKTPWALHYMDALEEVLTHPYERLIDMDLATMRLALRWLSLDTQVEMSDHYVEAGGSDGAYIDLRNGFHPKRPLPVHVPGPVSYVQVFSDRHGFVPRMSVIDLLCNCGPDAARIIRV